MLLPKTFTDYTLPYRNFDTENLSLGLMETDSQWNVTDSLMTKTLIESQ